MFRLTRTKGTVTALTAISTILLLASSPAFAQPTVGAGAGAGTGWEFIGNTTSQCGPIPLFLGVDGDEFILNHTGNYSAVDANGVTVAVYEGPTTMDITVGPHVISPAGTFPPCVLLPPGLVPSPLGLPIAITSATVDGTATDISGNPENIHCTLAPGPNGYVRIGSAVTFTFNSNCVINGDILPGPVTINSMQQVVEGTLNPCTVVPPLGFPPNPECDVTAYPAGHGAPSGHLVTAYEAGGSIP